MQVKGRLTAARAGGTYTPARVRTFLLALVVLGCLGLTAELLLLEHVASFTQWLPLAVLAGAFAVSVWVAVRPERLPLRVFQLVMLVVLATGATGVILHYRGNALFELEMAPTLSGTRLLWRSLTGATPVLAPGALVQLGLLGLVFAFGHPALLAPAGGGRAGEGTDGSGGGGRPGSNDPAGGVDTPDDEP